MKRPAVRAAASVTRTRSRPKFGEIVSFIVGLP
jgi:hypothetical protein